MNEVTSLIEIRRKCMAYGEEHKQNGQILFARRFEAISNLLETLVKDVAFANVEECIHDKLENRPIIKESIETILDKELERTESKL